MIEELPLPYSTDALAPAMSARSLEYHRVLYQRYVRRTNELTAGRYRDPMQALRGRPDRWWQGSASASLREQAAQVVAHEAFFASMRPPTSTLAGPPPAPQSPFGRRLDHSATPDGLVELANRNFGSGWLWVLRHGGRVGACLVHDAGVPRGQALLCLDLWEHAYYLDEPADRAAYVRTWIHELAAWGLAERLFADGVSLTRRAALTPYNTL